MAKFKGYGQISFFGEYMNNIFSSLLEEETTQQTTKTKKTKATKAETKKKPVVEQDKESEGAKKAAGEDYLTWGMRLMTMAKQSMPKHRDYTSLQEKLFKLKFPEPYCNYRLSDTGETLSLIASKIVRPLIRQSNGSNSKEMTSLKALTSCYDWDIYTFEELKKQEELLQLMPDMYRERGFNLSFLYGGRKKKYQQGDETLYMVIRQKGKSVDHIIVGPRMGTLSDRRRSAVYISQKQLRLGDLAYVVAFLIVLTTARTVICDEDFRKSTAFHAINANLKSVYQTGGLPNDAYSGNADASELDWDNDPNIISIEGRQVLLDSRLNGIFPERAGIEIPQVKNCELHKTYVGINLFLQHNYPVDKGILQGFLKGLEWSTYAKEIIRRFPTTSNTPLFLNYEQYFAWMIGHADKLTSDELDKLFSYETMRTFYGNTPLPLCPVGRIHTAKPVATVFNLFLAYAAVADREIRIMENERKSASDYAKSFETKKNIPLKILRKMEESELNSRFGYIEFDELCDLKAIDIVSDQILAFTERFFPEQDLKTVSLRFRRLGNHHAAGLYYPAYRCICVDINSPSSFVHEFGHMLDYLNGGLSNTLKFSTFSALYRAYKSRLEGTVKNNAVLKTQLSKGKYNLKYYTAETEVFARCFEIYFTKYIGLDNSLNMRPESLKSFAYPDDKEFLQLLKTYFEALPCMQNVLKYVLQHEKEMIA